LGNTTTMVKFRVGEDTAINSDILSLQYENPNFTMVVVLPKKNETVDSVITLMQLAKTSVSSLHNSLKLRNILLSLPKFSLQDKTDLVPPLKSLGVSSLFSPLSADLSSLSPSPQELYVTDILHQATVEVTEEGSEAAAATAISISTRGGFSSQDKFIVDRPFLFVILDLVNDIPLFMGKVYNPSGKQPSAEEGEEDDLVGVRTIREDEETNICVEQPGLCKNGGTCAVSAQDTRQFICACAPGFQGDKCQDGDLSNTETDGFVDIRADDDDDYKVTLDFFNPDLCEPGYNITAYQGARQEEGEQRVVRFPCPHQRDTQPIRDYREKHGDPSKLGVRGENANMNEIFS